MIRAFCAALFLALPGAVAAQSLVIETTPLDNGVSLTQPPPIPEPEAEKAETAAGVVLRALDKVSGETLDLDLTNGRSGQMFGLDVGLVECRFPAGNPAGDAYAYLVVRDTGAQGGVAFRGWMIASSPALSALDHARYDVWVLRCMTS